MRLFQRNKNPTKETPKEQTRIQMITTAIGGYFTWNGKMYESDIVRACIRPYVEAIGKLVGRHIREDPKNNSLSINPDARIRFLLCEPNPYMTGQDMQKKIAAQLALNKNAFILKIYNQDGIVVQLYPVPCVLVEKIWNKSGELFLRFTYKNGKYGVFKYEDIIHLRDDFNEDDVFGTSPAKALVPMMNVIGTIDQGIVKAIRNSGIVQWLLKFNTSMRPEDVKKNTEDFVKNYLSVTNESFGAAGVDAKADVTRIEPKDYVPNAAQQDRAVERIYSFFNTNKKIVQSDYSENEWNAYYESQIEPVVVQLGMKYGIALFSRRERGFGNRIEFAADNLQCASLTTKLALQAMVDRGAMTPNEWRTTMNMAPLPGGDEPIRRLDTQVVNLVESALNKMDDNNYVVVMDTVKSILRTGKEDKNGTNRHKGNHDTE